MGYSISIIAFCLKLVQEKLGLSSIVNFIRLTPFKMTADKTKTTFPERNFVLPFY